MGPGVRTTSVAAAALGLTGGRTYPLAGVLPPAPRLAVVGSRAARRRFRDAVQPLVTAAVRRGFSIVSGGAVGIDADAHTAALVTTVPQLAVLPCGPDRPYPPQHVRLFEAIAAAPKSGVLHAQPEGTQPTRAMFASRNAIVVALCEAVVVVQAAARSGTMVTATQARRRHRACAAVVGSTGAAVVIAAGAHALPWDPESPQGLEQAAEAWLAAVRVGQPPVPAASAVWPEHLVWLREAVVMAGPGGLDLERLPRPRAALVALTEAQLLGLVVEVAPGRYLGLG